MREDIQWTRSETIQMVGDHLIATMAYRSGYRDKIVAGLGQHCHFPSEMQQSAWEIMQAEHINGRKFGWVDIAGALRAANYQQAASWLMAFGDNEDFYVDEATIAEACERIVHYSKHKSFNEIVAEKIKEAKESGRDVSLIASELASALEEIDRVASVRFRSMADEVDQIIMDKDSPEERNRIIPTPIPELNRIIRGFKPGDYIALGGSVSSGKTSFVLGAAKDYCDNGGSVWYCTLDQTPKSIAERFIVGEYGRPIDEISSDEVRSFRAEYGKTISRLLHDESKTGTVEEFEASARRAVKQNGCGMIILDYLGQLQSSKKTSGRYELTTNVSHRIKRIGLELDVPMLVVCQLSRDYQSGNVVAEKDQYPRPRLNHLRDSGAIEADANVVIFFHNKLKLIEAREGSNSEAYKKYAREFVKGDRVPVEIIVAKNKDGETRAFEYLFHTKTMTFVAGIETNRDEKQEREAWQNR